jgi:ATP-binding cassette, subfamily B, multidrug efflux pump
MRAVAVTGRVVDSYTNIHSVKLFAHQDAELNYAKEAIETSRTTFQKEMRIVTKMDVALTLLNGLMILGVAGLAMWFWADGQRRSASSPGPWRWSCGSTP